MYRKNPFLDLSLNELAEAYVNFTYMEDAEAIDWVEEAFCAKLILNITFNN
jgi:hypothetical protein